MCFVVGPRLIDGRGVFLLFSCFFVFYAVVFACLLEGDVDATCGNGVGGGVGCCTCAGCETKPRKFAFPSLLLARRSHSVSLKAVAALGPALWNQWRSHTHRHVLFPAALSCGRCSIEAGRV